MAILFNKSQTETIPPVEGQVSPSGQSVYTNGQWVGIPMAKYDPNIKKDIDAGSMVPNELVGQYGFEKKGKDPMTLNLMNETGAKQGGIYKNIVQSNVDLRMGGGPAINGIVQYDTLYPAGGRYRIDATGDRNSRMMLKMPTEDKGNVAWATRFLKNKPNK